MDLKFLETSPEYYEQEAIRVYEAITERILYPADPERLLINVFTYLSALLAYKIDWSAKQNLLAFAEGSYLDALAEFYGVRRLPAQPARTTLKFEVAEPLSFDVVIPKGTRATSDGNLIFATTAEAKIKAGTIAVEVQALCETPGSIGNGFAIGQINKLVDALPYVTKVENTTMSMYGADVEDDERFRERIRLSMERFSNAGSREAYIFHTKSAHPLIEDVEVFSPAPGQVKVVFLLKDGSLPDDSMLNEVATYLNGEKIRPLTDQVFVLAPEVMPYEVKLRYKIHRKDETRISEIQRKVEKAVSDFIYFTGVKVGRDVLPEELIKRVKEAGAYRVVVESPTYVKINLDQVAKGTISQILYEGLSDD